MHVSSMFYRFCDAYRLRLRGRVYSDREMLARPLVGLLQAAVAQAQCDLAPYSAYLPTLEGRLHLFLLSHRPQKI